MKIQPDNPIITIINDFTPSGVDQTASTSALSICTPIDNDELDALMTGKSVEEIKTENKQKSRLQRYINTTGINPFSKSTFKRKTMSGGLRKKTNKRRSNKRRSNKRRSNKRRSNKRRKK